MSELWIQYQKRTFWFRDRSWKKQDTSRSMLRGVAGQRKCPRLLKKGGENIRVVEMAYRGNVRGWNVQRECQSLNTTPFINLRQMTAAEIHRHKETHCMLHWFLRAKAATAFSAS